MQKLDRTYLLCGYEVPSLRFITSEKTQQAVSNCLRAGVPGLPTRGKNAPQCTVEVYSPRACNVSGRIGF